MRIMFSYVSRDPRAAVALTVAGIKFPATREELIRRAQARGALSSVLVRLRALKADRFDSPYQLLELIDAQG